MDIHVEFIYPTASPSRKATADVAAFEPSDGEKTLQEKLALVEKQD
jgi:hypothetical protein